MSHENSHFEEEKIKYFLNNFKRSNINNNFPIIRNELFSEFKINSVNKNDTKNFKNCIERYTNDSNIEENKLNTYVSETCKLTKINPLENESNIKTLSTARNEEIPIYLKNPANILMKKIRDNYFTNENIVKIKIHSTNHNNMPIKSNKKPKEITIQNNDFTTIKHLSNKNPRMKLIQKDKMISLNFGEFSKLKDKVILNICEYMGNDLQMFFILNKQSKRMFLSILIRILKTKMCQNLTIYKEIFIFDSAKLTICKTEDENKKNVMKFNLTIKAKLNKLDEYFEKCLNFGYIYKFYDKKPDLYQTVYKFELKPPKNKSVIWIMKEESNYQNDLHNKAYFQTILPFMGNDFLSFSVNLNRNDCFLDFSKFKWIKHTKETSINMSRFIFNSSYNYNKNKEANLDLTRICEIEFIKKSWKDVTEFTETTFDHYLNKFDFNTNEKILENLVNYRKISQPLLTLVQANADIDCYILFKLIFEAVAVGKLKNEELGITITVRDENESLTNEVKKNGLLFDTSNEIEVRKGDFIVFYLSKKKKEL